MSRLETEKASSLFEGEAVYTRDELATRARLWYESYMITVRVEAFCLLDMLTMMIIPTAHASHGADGQSRAVTLAKQLEQKVEALRKAIDNIDRAECETREQAHLCTELRLGLMGEIRMLCDRLEKMVHAKDWPLATFKELLFDDMARCSVPLAH
mmetsp:Transcript_33636/g.66977  ORF Transcript_33636/g.66977 Transcript_33636/m.66977 type:complete len:155 (-) Transcript_33636:161-625(-)